LILGSIIIFYSNKKVQKTVVVAPHLTPAKDAEIIPGSNKAVLTLADGSTISLDKAKNGLLANQGTAKVVKLNNGNLLYTAVGKETENVYNTLSTPRGGQYQVTLPDNTKVWLNAESSINYPTAFSGKSRIVALTGEAYFEVAKNAKMPFIVKHENLKIVVLGTHFNVNTYKDENVTKTTLLEGSIKISNGKNNKLIIPGEQAQTDNVDVIKIVKDIDVNTVVAWKNGLFNFNKSDIKAIMNQLARWYDIDIKYSGQVSNQLYGGEIERDLKLSQVLKILEKSGVHFRIDNKTLVVMQ
ncbi:MAG TPA: FecR family protein, partial [Chitinophagaceae bacterium]|nr:FecR family protein [Chitinophagaceae bacterium]